MTTSLDFHVGHICRLEILRPTHHVQHTITDIEASPEKTAVELEIPLYTDLANVSVARIGRFRVPRGTVRAWR